MRSPYRQVEDVAAGRRAVSGEIGGSIGRHFSVAARERVEVAARQRPVERRDEVDRGVLVAPPLGDERPAGAEFGAAERPQAIVACDILVPGAVRRRAAL